LNVRHKASKMMDVQITKWNDKFRKHTHTTPTHVNRQTNKECAWGRPRVLHTVLKCYFFKIFRDMSRKGYCVTISRRSKSKLLREAVDFTWERPWTNNANVLFERQP